MKINLKITLNKISPKHIFEYLRFAGIALMLLMQTNSFSIEYKTEYGNYYAYFFDWQFMKEWFFNLGEKYNVNPNIFGGIYVGAIPFFTLSLGWLIKRIKKKESIVLPALSTGFFFISAYLYLIMVGHNVPIWVYGIILIMVIYGFFSTVRKIKSKTDLFKV